MRHVESAIGYAAVLLLGSALLFMLYMVFVWVPVVLWAEGKCLAKGYPKTNVTVGLQVYCMTIDGSMTVKVEKLQ